MDVIDHERLSNTTLLHKLKYRNFADIAVLHFSVNVGSSRLYLDIYWRDNLIFYRLLSLKIKSEITIIFIIHLYIVHVYTKWSHSVICKIFFLYMLFKIKKKYI
jgi:hypothetical protein